MADSVVEIVNTTLTKTELPNKDTSYDLITTDANTSYVIKDVQVNSALTNLTATINGFGLGDWSSSLTGSEVVDVSSTLSVKSNSFPAKITLNNAYYRDNVSSQIDNLNQNKFLFNNGSYVNEAISTDSYGGYTGVENSAGQAYAYTYVPTGTGSIYQIYQNTTHYINLARWDNAGSVDQFYMSGSYNIAAWDPSLEKIYYTSTNGTFNLYEIDYKNSSSGVLLYSGANRGIATASRPRVSSCQNYLFYSLSDDHGLYGVLIYNKTTGYLHTYTGLYNYGSNGFGGNGPNWSLAVSYDAASDYFTVYRKFDSTSYKYIWKDVLPMTKTVMDAYTSDQNISTASTGRGFKDYSALDSANSLKTNGGAGNGIYGDDTVGNKLYFVDYTNTKFYSLEYDSLTATAFYDPQVNLSFRPHLNTYVGAGNDPDFGVLDGFQIRITGVKTTA